MKKQLFIANVFAIAILFVNSLLFPVSGYTSQNETTRSRYPAPDFNLLDLNVEFAFHSTSNKFGKHMMFWTTW